MAAPLRGVGKAASMLMPKTAPQEGKYPGGIEINHSAVNPVKDLTCQLK